MQIIKRISALAVLTGLLNILFIPATFAAVTDEGVLSKFCVSGGGLAVQTDVELDTSKGNSGTQEAIGLNGTKETFPYYKVKEIPEGTSAGTAESCGKPGTNGTLNLGDCTAANAKVAEITEPIGPSIKLGENEEVIDVYKGICCLNPAIEEKDGASTLIGCETTRELYFDNYTTCNEKAAFCEKRQWLISKTGAGIIKIFVKQMYIFGAGIVGFIAVAVIVVSGIQISVSGVSGDITNAKERIIQSITGLVLLFLSGLILYTINPTFFS